MPINFTLTYTHKTNDPTDDTGDVAAVPVSGEVLAVAQLPDGAAAVGSDGGYSIKTFKGYLDAGVLKSKVGGATGMRLWANDPAVFGLTQLPYKVLFDVRDPNGLKVNINPVTFLAPSIDGSYDLKDFTPTPGAVTIAVPRVVTYVDNGNGTITFYVNGVAAGPPVSILTAGDEYQEFANLAAFPVTGTLDRLYLAKDTAKIYRWTGSAYLQIADKASVGLGNVDNTSDANKPVSTAQQAALDGKQTIPASSAAITTNTAPTRDQITIYDATSGALAVALPALSGLTSGWLYPVQRYQLDVSVNAITFTPNGADTFDSGATTFSLPLTGELRYFQVVTVSAVKKWKVVNGNTPVGSIAKAYIRPAPSFEGVSAVLQHGRSSVIQGIGDSTMLANPGWFPALCTSLGQLLDATVLHCQWNDTNQAYDPPTVVQTSSQGERTATPLGSYVAAAVTGDLEIIMKLTQPDWTTTQWYVSKWWGAGNQMGFSFGQFAGNLRFEWSANGTSSTGKSSTAAIPFSASATGWVRVTFDVDNGSSGNDLKFYTSTDGTTWTQLGSTVTTAGVTSIFASTQFYQLGSREQGTSGTMSGTISWVQINNALANGTDVVPRLPEKWSPDTTTVLAGGPTILIMNGSRGGQNLIYFDDSTRRPKMLTALNPDVVFVATGHNDNTVSPGQFVDNYTTFVRHVKYWRPGVPIIVTTQNPVKIGSSITTTTTVQINKARTAMMAVAMAAEPGVTVMDTQRAYTDIATQISSDGLHPQNYTVQMVWMLRRLVPELAA